MTSAAASSSSSFSDANTAPLAALRMSDTALVGGKNASLGRTHRRLGGGGSAGARRFRRHHQRLSAVFAAGRAGRIYPKNSRRFGCQRHDRPRRFRRRHPPPHAANAAAAAGGIRHSPRVCRDDQKRRRVRCRALFRHRRRFARCLLCRTAGHFSQHFAARKKCWRRCGRFLHLCLPPAPFPIASIAATIPPPSPFPPECKQWRAATWPPAG